jgi:hypothetical protein
VKVTSPPALFTLYFSLFTFFRIEPVKTSRIIVLGVILGAVADVVAIGYGTGKSFPHPAVVVGYALLFAQASAAAIWLGIGSDSVVLRLVAHLAILVGIYLGLSRLHDHGLQWLQLLTVQTLAVTGPLAVGRSYGLRLDRTATAASEEPWQFTLKHVFLMTTICALVLGLIRLMPRLSLGHGLAEGSMIGAGFALMALVAAWVAIGYGPWYFKLLALPAVTLLVGCLVAAVDGGRSAAAVMALVFCQTLFLTGWLAVLRRCGFRLALARQPAWSSKRA